ncbi:hypothetical protein AaE_003403 [Aphanomyces astaci]|uniref:Uncharacterized protein n=1 Tax=Aphanomyces astaci TaxID=112090 RepID=A0A6A5AL62_APHAT|nr:hypothetical protein AaE_003403 [Aphanomyces astaci]
MKDASTQFTGNHVLIQADLNPHHQGGACNDTTAHFQSPPPFSCHTSPKPQPPVEPTTDSTQPPPDPNAPVDSHGMMGTFMDATMASVNTTLSTSMYRQQLQHIQTQIRRKRLESERVMREAMAYRYTSMDAAEKFVGLNRPKKLSLWQALMQVDPLMSKEQAMKIEAMSKSA